LSKNSQFSGTDYQSEAASLAEQTRDFIAKGRKKASTKKKKVMEEPKSLKKSKRTSIMS
jgi:hypothetical protein